MNPSFSKDTLPPQLLAELEAMPPDDRAALVEAWRFAGEARPEPAVPDAARKAAVWAALEAAMDAPEAEPVRRDRTPAAPRAPHLRLVRHTTMRWLAAAAVVAVLFSAGVAYWLQPVRIVAPNGSKRIVDLPDGSRVELNSGSVLAYARGFDERIVELEGEAFFEVEPDAARPFVVATFNANTTVLGTSFNVRARRDDVAPATSVVVATGRVRLAPREQPDTGIVLMPGSTSSLAAGEQRPSAPDSVVVSRALAWRSGGFQFSNQPLGMLFAEVERRFDVTIQASEQIATRPSAYYKHAPSSAEEILKEITTATNLRYRATANGFEVYAP